MPTDSSLKVSYQKTAFINSGFDQANPHLTMGVLKVEALEVQA